MAQKTLHGGGGQRMAERITADTPLFYIDFGEVWRYRALIPLLLRRDFFSEFAQTFLGPVWFIIHPLMQSVVFALIFGTLAKISTDGAAPFLFYNSGFIIWTYFNMACTYVSYVFINNSGLFSKVYFPRLIMPIAIVLFRLISFLVNFCMFLGFLLVFHLRGANIAPGWWAFATPLVLCQTIALAIGIGSLAAALTARYRDMIHVLSYLLGFWMYATPIVYPLSAIPYPWRLLFFLNPMTSVVEVFRHGWLGTGEIHFAIWAVNAVTTAVVLGAGIVAFNYTEKTVIDTV